MICIFTLYEITIFLTCIFNIIFAYRANKRYRYIKGYHIGHLALILFTCIIPIINMLVSLYYAIFLFGNFKNEYLIRKLN